MSTEFVKGWLLLDTLGEGRFGEVKLLMNKESKEMVAVKVIITGNPEMDKQIRKEICIHKNLNHPNIIGFYGDRRDSNIEYLFLEYAQGGELFDRIEPDVGMDKNLAFCFFSHLLSGLEYLHSRGIVHRDIKPENLLLNANDILKISDFGMSTLFRHNGKERLLDQVCGSFLYMAPEVIKGEKHRAEPIDIWSSGIVLIAMLTGELPWDQATVDKLSYKKWLQGKQILHQSPWCKIENLSLSLLKCILNPDPSKRYTLKQILNHRLMKSHASGESKSAEYQTKRRCLGFASQPTINNSSSSQINNTSNVMAVDGCIDYDLSYHQLNSFSQPSNIDDMFLSTQTQMELCADGENNFGSQGSCIAYPHTKLYLRVVRRMTRFFTNINFDQTILKLQHTFDDLNYSYKKHAPGQFTITINDKKRMPLIFKSSVNEMNSNTILVDFRLSKGNGIEFKRQFLTIKNILKPIIQSCGPNIFTELNF